MIQHNEQYVRSVTLQVVVDVHCNTRISRLVRARKSDLRRISAATSTDVYLRAADVLVIVDA